MKSTDEELRERAREADMERLLLWLDLNHRNYEYECSCCRQENTKAHTLIYILIPELLRRLKDGTQQA